MKGLAVALPQDHSGGANSWRGNSPLQGQDAVAVRVTSHNIRARVLVVDGGAIVDSADLSTSIVQAGGPYR
jgi:hypothetical protein